MAPQAQTMLSAGPMPAMSSSTPSTPSSSYYSQTSSSSSSSSSASAIARTSANPNSAPNSTSSLSLVSPTKPPPTTAASISSSSTPNSPTPTPSPAAGSGSAPASTPAPAPVPTTLSPTPRPALALAPAPPATPTPRTAAAPPSQSKPPPQPSQPPPPGPGPVSTSATSAPRPIPSSSSKTVISGISDLNRSILDLTISLLIPPPDLSSSPSSSSSPVTASSSYCSSLYQTPLDSLRRQPTDLTTPIPEECDEETCSESLPNDPVTPVSGRQSRDFRFCDSQDLYHRDSLVSSSLVGASLPTYFPKQLDVQPALQPTSVALAAEDSPTPTKNTAGTYPDQTPSAPATSRPISRRSSSTLSRAMSSLFRRSAIFTDENGAASPNAAGSGAASPPKESSFSTGTSESSLATVGRMHGQSHRRRFSYHRSVATTRSNTPPSPGSPLEMTMVSHNKADASQMPTSRDFLDNNAKKQRAHTGLSLRQRVNFVGNAKNHPPRRARSLERKRNTEENHLTRQPWAIPPDAGTGMKARRLSLSLPDDFTVDIAELLKEYEYQHKFLGRHGKHLGKGATSKVTLMVRKGCPGELYAVKEFRSKTSSESAAEYEKKIKSEYSIAKSLHHPNVIETFRLCTDHGRWNHVMEYCSEGDLFSLVSKKYLRDEGRDVDRVCLFKQLCQGINYLHNNGIAHRDIKLENLLITKDSKLKITDFGVSEVFSGIHPGLRESGGQCGVAMGEVRLCKPGICGSLPYIAPEVLSKKEEYDPRPLDVWSSAIVMVYLIFGANIWEKAEAGLSSPVQKNYNDLVQGWEKTDAKKLARPDTAKDAYPKLLPFEYFVKPLPLRRILLNMLHPDPKKRMTMNDVVTNRWMKNVECCQLESYDDPVKYIDASKKDCMKSNGGKIFCHNHLPPMSTGHGLPPMPGKPGY
ncbi:kinase-like domain-containing protein [Xylaria sp. FL0064]|nr:kinase-like domain-containing protein [Xylaria sp. FL0064]